MPSAGAAVSFASALLTCRPPRVATSATAGLNLESTGVETNEAGAIVVDDQSATTCENVFAVGDVISRVDLTPVAIAAGRRLGTVAASQGTVCVCVCVSVCGVYVFLWCHPSLEVVPHCTHTRAHVAVLFAYRATCAAADALFGGKPTLMDYTNVPTVVFSHPTIGTIGLCEDQAKEKFGEDNVTVYRRCGQTLTRRLCLQCLVGPPQPYPVATGACSKFTNMFYSMSEHKPKTVMKLVCSGEEQKVVGLHIIGLAADEMLQGFSVAVKVRAGRAPSPGGGAS